MTVRFRCLKGYNQWCNAGQAMSVEGATPNPAHLTEAEKAAIEDQLERLLLNRHFNHSRRFPAFLRFVVQKTLAGEMDQLKERTLGVEIFGRNADYDTSSDPIVRVTAAEIRKRIAQYYQEPGHEAELRISVEAGSYVPQFHWPQEGHHAAPAVAVALVATAGGLAESSAAPIATAARGKRWRPAITVVLLLALVAAAITWTWRDMHQSPIEFFWGPVLSTGDPTLFCVADQNQYPVITLRDADDPTRLTMFKDIRSPIIMDDPYTIVKVAGVLQSRGKKYTLKGEGTTTLTDLRAGPAIFIGAFDNAWTLRMTRPLRYHFGNNADFTRQWIADSNSTQPPVWFTERTKLEAEKQETGSAYREYAIVARFTDPDTGQLCVVVAGIGRGGTIAAGEFLTTPAELAQLERMAKSAGSKKNIEVVLSTQIIDGQPGTAKIEATYFW